MLKNATGYIFTLAAIALVGIIVLIATHSTVVGETTLATTGSWTDTLPAPIASGRCRITNAGSGTITPTTTSGTLYDIAGATGNISLATHTSRSFMSDGTNWYQVS